MLRISFLMMALSLLAGAHAEQQASSEGFQCRNPSSNETMSLLDILDNVFDSVSLGFATDKCKNQKLFVPKTTNWHVFAIEETEAPRISMFPEGLVEPFVKGSTLKFDFQRDATDGFSKGENIQAGVSIFLPSTLMTKIIFEGVDAIVEVRNNLASPDSMIIKNSGVDGTFYLSSPNTKVKYEASGVDNTAFLEVASGSTMDLSGVDQDLHIKTSDDADIEVTMSGVNQRLTIDGDYTKIKASGVDAKIFINGPKGCNDISSSGVAIDCSITEETVVVPDISCLATSKVQKWRCSHFGPLSTGAAAGVGIGVVVLIISICVLSCWGCYKCFGGGRHRTSHLPSPPVAHHDAEKAIPDHVVAAEVTGIDGDDDHHHHHNSPLFVEVKNPHSFSNDHQGVLEAEIVVDTAQTTSKFEKDLIAVETGLGKTA